MSQFPALVYKVPGKHVRPRGTYDFTGVNNAEELEVKLKEGWFWTLEDAIDPPKVAKVEPEVESVKESEVLDDSTPPTRDELEAKATELGIKFDGRFSDKKIAGLIAESLGA